jgi:hypothetical protein
MRKRQRMEMLRLRGIEEPVRSELLSWQFSSCPGIPRVEEMLNIVDGTRAKRRQAMAALDAHTGGRAMSVRYALSPRKSRTRLIVACGFSSMIQ